MSFIVAAPDVVQEDGPTVVIADGEEELSMKRKNLSILTKNNYPIKLGLFTIVCMVIYRFWCASIGSVPPVHPER